MALELGDNAASPAPLVVDFGSLSMRAGFGGFGTREPAVTLPSLSGPFLEPPILNGTVRCWDGIQQLLERACQHVVGSGQSTENACAGQTILMAPPPCHGYKASVLHSTPEYAMGLADRQNHCAKLAELMFEDLDIDRAYLDTHGALQCAAHGDSPTIVEALRARTTVDSRLT